MVISNDDNNHEIHTWTWLIYGWSGDEKRDNGNGKKKYEKIKNENWGIKVWAVKSHSIHHQNNRMSYEIRIK